MIIIIKKFKRPQETFSPIVPYDPKLNLGRNEKMFVCLFFLMLSHIVSSTHNGQIILQINSSWVKDFRGSAYHSLEKISWQSKRKFTWKIMKINIAKSDHLSPIWTELTLPLSLPPQYKAQLKWTQRLFLKGTFLFSKCIFVFAHIHCLWQEIVAQVSVLLLHQFLVSPIRL